MMVYKGKSHLEMDDLLVAIFEETTYIRFLAIPIDELISFRGVETTNQVFMLNSHLQCFQAGDARRILLFCYIHVTVFL